jgi:hypothetical protein
MTAELCPVCKGRGQVPVGFYEGWDTAGAGLTTTCRGCGGTGVVFDYRPRSIGNPPPSSPYRQINSCVRPVNGEYDISYQPTQVLCTSASEE